MNFIKRALQLSSIVLDMVLCINRNRNEMETDAKTNKYFVTTNWKPWTAGTDILELHLQGKTGSSLKIDNVYIVVRPMQY